MCIFIIFSSRCLRTLNSSFRMESHRPSRIKENKQMLVFVSIPGLRSWVEIYAMWSNVRFFIRFIYVLSHRRQMATHDRNSINCILRSEALCLLHKGKKLRNLLSTSLTAMFDRITGQHIQVWHSKKTQGTERPSSSHPCSKITQPLLAPVSSSLGRGSNSLFHAVVGK